MSGAIHGGLLVVIASFAFLLLRHSLGSASNAFQRHTAGLEGALLMMCLQLGMLGVAMVLYAWALHGIAALGTGLAIGASGVAGACLAHQRRPAQRSRLSPRTQPLG